MKSQYKSLIKNWPGGRRKALVIESCPFEGTYLTWNKSIEDIPINLQPNTNLHDSSKETENK